MRTPVKLVPRAELQGRLRGLRGRSRSHDRHEAILPVEVQILNAEKQVGLKEKIMK